MQKRNSSRTYNSIVNSVVGIFATIITIILNFFVRIVIIKQLGEEVNGIHSLFQSITNMMALIEAGFSTAMVIHLYKPVAEQDKNKIIGIIKFYRKVYIVISIIFILIGLFVNAFFIDDLVKSSIPISQIHFYFLVYMLITPVNYLTYYKISILYAEQNNKIYFIISTISQLIFRMLQIILLFKFKSYSVFLILLILEKITCNLICSKYINKNNPYLKEKNNIELSKKDKKAIFSTVKPIFISNIASNVQGSTKEILISMLQSNVKYVGYFGNYQLITSTAKLLFSQFGGAITSSFGNLAVENNQNKMYEAFKKVSFILNWIAILLCSGFICCIQTFIFLAFGKNFVLPNPVAILIVLELYIYLLNIPIISIQNALGLHKEDQYIMIFQTIASAFVGYFLGRKYGMLGVLIGLLIPQFFLTLINKRIVIYKKAFNIKKNIAIKSILLELLKGIFVCLISISICSLIRTNYIIVNLILKGLISILITFIMFYILSKKSQYYQESINLVKKIIRRKKA